ncbi:MAG: Uma2 family endonuclease [Hyphomicrobiaceae bacterium]|nr:Uma2 family endonuclease [Hyphomicrobiaceae bacterium]
MAGEHPGMSQTGHWYLTLPVFQAFRDDRPKEEKWELIDGRPTMMPPPTLVHQRICRNISSLLNNRLALVKPEWAADGEVGLLLASDETFNPAPDITVIDRDVELGQIYAERFYAVVEVFPPNDKAWVLDSKIGYYTRHDHCSAVMFVEQARMACRMWSRAPVRGWSKVSIDDPAARLVFPVIGDFGALFDCYRHTPVSARPGGIEAQ